MRFEPPTATLGTYAGGRGLLLLPTFAVVALSLIGHELGFSAVADAVDPWIAQHRHGPAS